MQILKYALYIIITYMALAMLTMGIVLFFYFEKENTNSVLVILSQLLLIPTTAFILTRFGAKWLKIDAKIGAGIVGVLLTIVAGLNLYLDVSLEPVWFVIVNLMLGLIGLFWAAMKAKSTSKSNS